MSSERRTESALVKERMTWEDVLRDQFMAAVKMMQENNKAGMQSYTRALIASIGPSTVDETFADDLRDADGMWEQVKEQRIARAALRMREALCPDVVPQADVSNPPFEYWEAVLRAVTALFERKGLGLRRRLSDDV